MDGEADGSKEITQRVEPDQEELLHMLEDRIATGDLSEEDLRSLFVNVCPFTWGSV